MTLAFLIGLRFPISDGGSSDPSYQAGTGFPVRVIADGLTYAFDSQAQTVEGALSEVGVEVSPEDVILRNGAPVHPAAPLLSPSPSVSVVPSSAAIPAIAVPVLPSAPIVLQVQRAVPFVLHEGGLNIAIRSAKETVGEALAAAGVKLGPADLVRPGPQTPLSAGLHVYVRHARSVRLVVGNETSTVFTFANTVEELLREQGIVLRDQDRLIRTPDASLSNGLTTVKVTFLRVETEVEKEIIPREVVYYDDPDLEIGEFQTVSLGSDGYIRRQYRITFENDRRVSRQLVIEEVVAASQKVVARGTKIVPKTLLLADGTVITYIRALDVYATWYNAVSAGGNGITATGVPLERGIVAVDPSVIPMGTRMYIPGYGYGVAADTGGAIVGYTLDLGYPGSTIGSCCTGWITIYILE